MVKLILILALGFVGVQAQSDIGACIPIGKVVILKKSIMTLELSQEQKAKLLSYEEKLKTQLDEVRERSNKTDETLSSMFDENNFLKDKFVLITKKENLIIADIISEYFENMYRALTKEQRVKLIKRFKRIERKRDN